MQVSGHPIRFYRQRNSDGSFWCICLYKQNQKESILLLKRFSQPVSMLIQKICKKAENEKGWGREGGNNSCFSFYFIGQSQQKTNRRWMFKQLLYQILKDKTDVKRTNMRSLSPNTRGMLPHHTIWLGQRLSPLTSLFPFSTLLRIKSCIYVNLVAFYHTPTHNN